MQLTNHLIKGINSQLPEKEGVVSHSLRSTIIVSTLNRLRWESKLIIRWDLVEPKNRVIQPKFSYPEPSFSMHNLSSVKRFCTLEAVHVLTRSWTKRKRSKRMGKAKDLTLEVTFTCSALPEWCSSRDCPSSDATKFDTYQTTVTSSPPVLNLSQPNKQRTYRLGSIVQGSGWWRLKIRGRWAWDMITRDNNMLHWKRRGGLYKVIMLQKPSNNMKRTVEIRWKRKEQRLCFFFAWDKKRGWSERIVTLRINELCGTMSADKPGHRPQFSTTLAGDKQENNIVAEKSRRSLLCPFIKPYKQAIFREGMLFFYLSRSTFAISSLDTYAQGLPSYHQRGDLVGLKTWTPNKLAILRVLVGPLEPVPTSDRDQPSPQSDPIP